MRTKQPLNITVDKNYFEEVKKYLDENMINTSNFFNNMLIDFLKIIKICNLTKISFSNAKSTYFALYAFHYGNIGDDINNEEIKHFFKISDEDFDSIEKIVLEKL